MSGPTKGVAKDGHPKLDRLAWLSTAFLVMALGCRPVSSPELWWELSRGRAVLDGVLAPGRFFLAGDGIAESDWLGGLPSYLLMALCGAAGLAVLKLGMLAFVLYSRWQRFRRVPLQWRMLICGGLAFALAAECEPNGRIWDVILLVISLDFLERLRGKTQSTQRKRTVSLHDDQTLESRVTLLTISFLASVWTNLGPKPILLLLPLAASFNRVLGGPKACLAVLLGCCISPRGPMAVWDAVRSTAPWLVESNVILSRADMGAIWQVERFELQLGWVLLSLVCCLAMWLSRRSTGVVIVVLIFAQLLGMHCWLCAPTLAIFFAHQAAGFLSIQSDAGSATGQGALRGSRFNTHPELQCDGGTPDIFTSRFRRVFSTTSTTLGLATVYVVLGGMVSLGVPPFSHSRLGWGVNRALEDRELSAVLRGDLRSGSAICTDVLAAGAICWNEIPHVRPWLVPHRALLNGTLRQEVLLTRDLESGWLLAHRRTDGTQGGWWLTLQERQTVLIVADARREKLISGLEPTIWKPLSLDSPIIPFAVAGDPVLSSQIVRMLEQRSLIDRGPWRFQIAESSGNDRLWDVMGWVTGWPDSNSVRRQAMVLRAMELPQAALRVLRPVMFRFSTDERVRQELIRCQREMVQRATLVSGRGDIFREAILKQLEFRQQAPEDLKAAVDAYLASDVEGASRLLNGDSPEIMASRASLLAEAGLKAEAFEAWRSLLKKFPMNLQAVRAREALGMVHE